MSTTEARVGSIGILVAIISFFLMRTMSKLDLTHDMATQNKLDNALLKKEYDLSHQHISEKLDDIKLSIEEVKKEVKK